MKKIKSAKCTKKRRKLSVQKYIQEDSAYVIYKSRRGRRESRN
jgi:hypothetical protein